MPVASQPIAVQRLDFGHGTGFRLLGHSDVERLQHTHGLPAVLEVDQGGKKWDGMNGEHALPFCAPHAGNGQRRKEDLTAGGAENLHPNHAATGSPIVVASQIGLGALQVLYNTPLSLSVVQWIERVPPKR